MCVRVLRRLTFLCTVFSKRPNHTIISESTFSTHYQETLQLKISVQRFDERKTGWVSRENICIFAFLKGLRQRHDRETPIPWMPEIDWRRRTDRENESREMKKKNNHRKQSHKITLATQVRVWRFWGKLFQYCWTRVSYTVSTTAVSV